MKLPLFAILAFLPCLACAQSAPDASSSTEPHHHHHSVKKQLAHLTAKLGLSDTQQEQIKPILVAKEQILKTIHEDTSLSKEQKHKQKEALFKGIDKRIEAVLNPSQVSLFKALHHHHAKPSQ